MKKILILLLILGMTSIVSSATDTYTIRWIVPDTESPTWDNLRNFSVYNNSAFSESITASDPNGIDSYKLNDTGNFIINDSSGLIENTTSMSPIQIYWLQIIVNDTLNNTSYGIFYINVSEYVPPSITGFTADDMYIAYNYENIIQGDIRFNYGWEY
ncbi:hypothetical protein GF386_04090 [Candidatus Pacearchaeota archaeon]|nr:hypothetical protein [Candidatus Pacearchaeota archaeon]